MIRNISICLMCVLSLAGCKIENDIPYPVLEGNIEAFEVEGQCDAEGNSGVQSIISKSDRTVKLYVDDTVDLSKLRITKFVVSNDAEIVIDTALCNNPQKFPFHGFASLEEMPVSTDTRVDFTAAVNVTLRTYQDYQWNIEVKQIIKRDIMLENQIGDAVIDEVTRNVVIYVAPEQPLNAIKVTSFKLGGQHGTVAPDPTAVETFDFSGPVKFQVANAWEEISREWTVYVYHADGESAAASSVFPMTTKAMVSGKLQSGKQPVVEYKGADAADWTTVPEQDITVSGTSYTAAISKLSPATVYQYRVVVDGATVSEDTFKTTEAIPLADGSFDNWHQSGKLWNPWDINGTSFWDTGNRGATTISESNTTPTSETCNGSGQAASLESKYLLVKFAAGSMFAGSYLRTEGTNGVLSFGRPFAAFPTKLRVNYKYTPAVIDKVGETAFANLKGKSDSCYIYVALTDWDEPREIRTSQSNRQLFDKNDPHIIAYAELIRGDAMSSYEQKDLTLEYRSFDRTPKYIVVVATSSKYGDYFTGGVGSKLLLDNFELIYE